MLIKKMLLLLFVAACLYMVNQATAQNRFVKVKFEINNESINCDCKLFLLVGEKEIMPKMSKEGFEVPKEIESYEKVGVKFLCGKRYSLSFGSVYKSKFQTDWIVGIDKRPFDSENLPTVLPEEEVDEIHYIRFESEKGDGTIITTEVPKNHQRR